MIQKVHWVCDSPTPYNAFLFRALSSEFDLTVHYVNDILGISPWQSDLRRGYMSHTFQRQFGVDWSVINIVRANQNSILVSGGWHEPTVQLALSICALGSHPFVVWTDTPQLGRKRSWLKARLRERWLNWLFHKARAVMGTGLPSLRVLQQMGAPKKALINFPCFIDLSLFTPCYRTSFYPHQVRFASVGRLCPEKGYDIAFYALSRLFKTEPKRFSYQIAGTGPEKAYLKQLAIMLGIGRQVQFVEWLEPDSVPSFLAAADIFLHPARIEPYGVAVLEAMASGLVVIGSDATGAVLDRIQPGVNGFVHHSENILDMATQLQSVLDRPENWPAIGRAARATAEEWPVSRAVETLKEIIMARI